MIVVGTTLSAMAMSDPDAGMALSTIHI